MQQVSSECLDDKVALNIRWWYVTMKDKQIYGCNLEHCPKCDSYLTSKGMEKDLKTATLDFVNNFWNMSYELSDIDKIKE